MKKMPVLVTGVGGGGHGEQILKALRMGALEYHIVGTDITPFSAGKSLVDEFSLLPRANEPGYVDALLQLALDKGVRALFHGSEPEMMKLAENRELFERHGIFVPVNPLRVINICQDKLKTCDFLKAQGFRVPFFREVADLSDLGDFETYPAVLKPVQGGGSANAFIVQDKEDLQGIGSYLLRISDRFILQEYVGTPEHEYTVGLLYGADGAYLNSIAVHRSLRQTTAMSIRARVPNRTGRTALGPELVISSGFSQGEIGRWPEVTGKCREIGDRLRPTAPINIQCRLVDGEVVPFEINPRFSGTTSLRAMVGYNEPDVLIRKYLEGESVTPDFVYGEGTILRSLKEHLVTSAGIASRK